MQQTRSASASKAVSPRHGYHEEECVSVSIQYYAVDHNVAKIREDQQKHGFVKFLFISTFSCKGDTRMLLVRVKVGKEMLYNTYKTTLEFPVIISEEHGETAQHNGPCSSDVLNA